MKPINQTKFSIFFSDGRRLTYGNCLVACVASFLDEQIEEVPNVYTFYGMKKHEDENYPLWLDVLNLWMEKKHAMKMTIEKGEFPPDEEYVIARGKSMRGRPHCCIFKRESENYVPFFDPHPTSQFLKEVNYYYVIKKIR